MADPTWIFANTKYLLQCVSLLQLPVTILLCRGAQLRTAPLCHSGVDHGSPCFRWRYVTYLQRYVVYSIYGICQKRLSYLGVRQTNEHQIWETWIQFVINRHISKSYFYFICIILLIYINLTLSYSYDPLIHIYVLLLVFRYGSTIIWSLP